MNDQISEKNTEVEQMAAFDEIGLASARNTRKKLIIIIAAAVVVLALISAVVLILGANGAEDTYTPYPPIDPSQLADTKAEDFDIFEYDEYLKYNRVIMLGDKSTGVSESIDEATYKNYGDGVKLMYEMVQAIINGDSKAYNSMVSEAVGHYESFTQQQLYDVRISRVSQTQIEGKSGAYTEYVFELEYKIHENNGSFKNNLLSDSARPCKVVINDASGKLLVVDIIEPQYKGN